MHQSEVQPFILAISTSAGIAQVAASTLLPTSTLSSDRTDYWKNWTDVPELFEFEITDYKQQSLELLPRLLDNMSRVGLRGEDCKGIACNIGPGGFTSLRTACGVAQGLATAWNCGVLPVSSFECMAAEFALKGGDLALPLVCFVDARLQEFYAAGMRWPQVNTLLPAFEMLRNPCQVMGNLEGVHSFCEMTLALTTPHVKLMDQAAFTILQDSAVSELCESLSVVNPGARGLSMLGVCAAQAGKLQEPFVLQPLYVREKVAQTTSERLAARDVGI